MRERDERARQEGEMRDKRDGVGEMREGVSAIHKLFSVVHVVIELNSHLCVSIPFKEISTKKSFCGELSNIILSIQLLI